MASLTSREQLSNFERNAALVSTRRCLLHQSSSAESDFRCSWCTSEHNDRIRKDVTFVNTYTVYM